jgi:DNA-binding transcriptional MerR regulator
MDIALAEALGHDRTLRNLDLGHAAALLGIAPDTLLSWEARFGFPASSPEERRYSQSEVLALRDCISDGVSIAAAVARARERTRGRRARTGASLTDRRGNGLAS